MYRIYWRPRGGGLERWAEAQSRDEVVTMAARLVVVDGSVGGELRVQSTDQGWTVPTTLGALHRWRADDTPPEALVASGWNASEALALDESDFAAQIAAPLARAVAHGLIRQHQADRLRDIVAQAVTGSGPAGRDVDPDADALAPFTHKSSGG